MRLRSLPTSGASRRRMPRFSRACVHVGVHAIHVIPLLIRDHFECQFVVIAEEQRPLRESGVAGVCCRMSTMGTRSSIRKAMKTLASAENEMPCGIRHPAAAEIRHRIVRPLVGFRQQHLVAIFFVHVAPQFLQRNRGFPGGFRNSCLRARKDRERRPAAFRPRPGQSRNPAPAISCGRPGCQSSNPADAKKSDASNTPWPGDPRTNWRLPRL